MSSGEYVMSVVLLFWDTIEGSVFCSAKQKGIKLFTTYNNNNNMINLYSAVSPSNPTALYNIYNKKNKQKQTNYV